MCAHCSWCGQLSCVVTSPISAFHPKTLKEVHALGHLRSGHFFHSHEAKGQRKEGALSQPSCPLCFPESALASSALGQSLPTWPPMLALPPPNGIKAIAFCLAPEVSKPSS